MTATAAAVRPETCPACAVDPTVAPQRYCAPKRCLCAHPDCPAFPSYRPLERPFAYVALLHPSRNRQETRA